MSAILHRDLSCDLPTAVSASGVYIADRQGKKYLDASGGAAVSCLGHAHPRIREAIVEQLSRIEFAHTSYFTTEPAEALAAKLIARAPAGFGKGAAAFLGSGSEAIEAALKLGRQYHLERGEPTRWRYISRTMGYHGNTLGALAVGGHAQRRAAYQPYLPEHLRVDACFPFRNKQADESDAAYLDRLIAQVESVIAQNGANTIAGFVAEPISGASLGSVVPVEGYFKRIREVCDRHGILLIADEVMCGMGRTGEFFAMTQEGVCPDIITVAKGLGAGYQPIGSVMACERVVNALRNGSGKLANGHTYMSHPVACAAAAAVIDVIEDDDLLSRVKQSGAFLETMLRDRFGDHLNVVDIRGRGLFWSLELARDKASAEPFPASRKLAAHVKRTAQDQGLICYPSSGCVDGTLGDHVLLAPPYICSDSELEQIVTLLGKTLDIELGNSAMAA